MTVKPGFLRRPGAIEEQYVRRDVSVWFEYTLGQADNSVKIELFEQILLDPRRNASGKQCAIWHDHARPSRFRVLPKLTHDELQEQQCRLARLLVDGEVVLYPALFLAPEWRIREDHVHPFALSDLSQRMAQAVERIYLRRFQPVQKKVHLYHEVG